jgi:hypothetical protein
LPTGERGVTGDGGVNAAAPIRSLALRGTDVVVLAMHAGARTAVPTTPNASLVVECDGVIDSDRVADALGRFLPACPWLAARLRRPFPWGMLQWRLPPVLEPPPIRRETIAAGDAAALRAQVEAELNAPFAPARETPVRFRIVDERGAGGEARSVLVVTWFHPLMDPRGAENLIDWLAAIDDGDAPEPTTAQVVAPADPRPLRTRGPLAARCGRHLKTLLSAPPASFARGLPTIGPQRVHVASFTDAGGARSPLRRGEFTGRLAVVGAAVARLAARRGLPDASFVIPVSVDLRPKGDAGPVIGNYLSFHFAHFTPRDATTPAALAAHLRSQLADALRANQIDANAVGMDLLRYRPLRWFFPRMPWANGTDICSFNAADTGPFTPAARPLFGRTVLNAYHAPGVPGLPGLGVFFNRCGDVQNGVVVWCEGVVTAEEATGLLDAVAADLAWHPRSAA